ncbi:MAG: methyltransferase [Anaerolineae bacterium]|nr:methyltransferase [Anaerolineae bacterium]
MMRKIQIHLPGGPATLALSAGIKGPDAGNEVMFSAVRTIDASHVFTAGPGSIPSALWATQNGAKTISWSDNANWAACLRESFLSSELIIPDHHISAGFDTLPVTVCDLALLHLPRGKAQQRELLELAAAILSPGGRLYFSGSKQEGVKSALKMARDLFKQAGIIAHKGGYHAGMAQRPTGDFPLPHLTFDMTGILLDGQPAQLVSCTGVFAAGRLDGGARTLIESLDIPRGSKVLDMGCGTGLVGLSALRKGADVSFSDVSARAVVSTQKTLLANGYQAEVAHTSGAEVWADATFDLVLCNPPFHKGHGVDYETTRYLLDEARRVLRSGGSLYLVANSFLKYRAWIERNFSQVTIRHENSQFRVWQGTRL